MDVFGNFHFSTAVLQKFHNTSKPPALLSLGDQKGSLTGGHASEDQGWKGSRGGGATDGEFQMTSFVVLNLLITWNGLQSTQGHKNHQVNSRT